jgi:YidC/Oxa1 family membrane protein insertase
LEQKLDIFYTVLIYPIVFVIEFVFYVSQKLFNEAGVSIIAVSAAISVLCLPLYNVAEKWQEIERTAQNRLKPKVDKIKAVFSGDERYMILSAYYRQNDYHPVFALRGAFGLLIQIPFFIAAYSYLSHLKALDGVSFLFIKNLNAPDALIPVGGGINILPIIMTVINCAAGAIYTKGFSTGERARVLITAAIFLALLYNSPAGLVLYWTMNNAFSLVKHCNNKITFKHKRIVLSALVSAVLAVLVYFMFSRRISGVFVRFVFAAVVCTAAAFVWLGTAPRLTKRLTDIFFAPRYTQKQLFAAFALSCGLLFMLTGLFLPTMLIASSPQEFSYIDNFTTPSFFIANTALQALGLFIFWPLCIYLLFSQNISAPHSPSGVTRGASVFLAIVAVILSFCALCDVFVFPGDYGLITLDIVFGNGVTHSAKDALLNIAVLAAVSAILAVLFIKKHLRVITLLAAACTLVSAGISVRGIVSCENEFKKAKTFFANKTEYETVSVEPIFNLSRTGRNTVVIMLDRATSAFVPQILAENPGLNGEYDGFVYYPNSLSFNGYTRLGAPPIFGGYEYTPLCLNKRDIPIVEKHNEALLLMPRVFSEAGYKVTVTDPPYPNYSFKSDLRIYEPYTGVTARITDGVYTKRWIAEHGFDIPSQSDVLKRNILWYSILRIAPLTFREGLYQRGSWSTTTDRNKLTVTLNGYAVLDYLPRLTGIEDKKENTALIMVNNTTHDPSLFQAPEYRPALNVTNYGNGPYSKYAEYHGNVAALMRLADWFTFLKKEGVYDNSRIIIVSDHGAQKDYISRRRPGVPNFYNFNPLLLVKDFDEHGPLKTDGVFMTNADVPFLAFLRQIENPVNPFTGNPVSTDAKRGPLYVAPSGGVHLEDPLATKISLDPTKDFYVYGDVLDPASWTRADKFSLR